MNAKSGIELGRVKIHHEAISTIASHIVSSVPGVIRMSGSIVENIAEKLGKKNPDKGIRTDILGEEVKIDVSIIVRFGAKIPEVSWLIQKNVRKAIEEMTGLHVKSVNVNIEGVQMGSKEDPIPKHKEECNEKNK